MTQSKNIKHLANGPPNLPVTRRQFPDRPILCVGGVVIQGDQVALIRRSQDPHRGEWTIPGGAVEIAEKIKAAVRREVQEETGLVVEPLDLVTVFERIIRSEGRVEYHYVVLDYICRRRRGRIRPSSDVSDAQWVARGELVKFKLKPTTIDVIQRGFQFFDNLK
jgi:8-oxo-dGTP diphosphatase